MPLWAFHSLCTSTRCVATGAALSDDNQQESSGSPIVLQFTDGQWQTTPYLQAPAECDTTYSHGGRGAGGNSADTETWSMSLQPQANDTLHGFTTINVLTNECGFQGSVFKTPIIATRIGDAPRSVVLADPALFQS